MVHGPFTLSPIIMEVENDSDLKETHLGGTHFSTSMVVGGLFTSSVPSKLRPKKTNECPLKINGWKLEDVFPIERLSLYRVDIGQFSVMYLLRTFGIGIMIA